MLCECSLTHVELWRNRSDTYLERPTHPVARRGDPIFKAYIDHEFEEKYGHVSHRDPKPRMARQKPEASHCSALHSHADP